MLGSPIADLTWANKKKIKHVESSMNSEAKPEWIQKVPGLNDYQDMLIEKAGGPLFYGPSATEKHRFFCPWGQILSWGDRTWSGT